MRKSRVMRVTTRATVRVVDHHAPGNPGGRGLPSPTLPYPPLPARGRPSFFSVSAKGKEESRGERGGGTARFDRNIKDRRDPARAAVESRGRPRRV